MARIGGALYVVIIVLGIFQGLVVRERVVEAGDPAATSENLLSLETLWRLGIAAEYVLLTCSLVLAVIFYLLLRPVSESLAMLVVLLNVVTIAIEGTAALYLVESLEILTSGGGPALELEAMASASLAMHSHGFAAALIFFGSECLVVGYLLVRSGLVPRVIGLMLALAGACYLTNSFALTVAPTFGEKLVPAILIPAFVGETSLALWLLIRGVRDDRAGSRPRNRLAVPSAPAAGHV